MEFGENRMEQINNLKTYYSDYCFEVYYLSKENKDLLRQFRGRSIIGIFGR
jgi:hypothetical protein